LNQRLDYYSGSSPPDIFVGGFISQGKCFTLAGNFSNLSNLYPKKLDDILSIKTSLYRVGKNLNIKKLERLVKKWWKFLYQTLGSVRNMDKIRK
jgi:hypothetical protein